VSLLVPEHRADPTIIQHQEHHHQSRDRLHPNGSPPNLTDHWIVSLLVPNPRVPTSTRRQGRRRRGLDQNHPNGMHLNVKGRLRIDREWTQVVEQRHHHRLRLPWAERSHHPRQLQPQQRKTKQERAQVAASL